MKKLYSFCVILVMSLLSPSLFAEEWLDVAEDLQKHIVTEVTISPEDQKHIDINLAWAHQCYNRELDCPVDAEKQSIEESMQQLEALWKKYQKLNIKSPILEYIVSKAEILRTMVEEEVPPM